MSNEKKAAPLGGAAENSELAGLHSTAPRADWQPPAFQPDRDPTARIGDELAKIPRIGLTPREAAAATGIPLTTLWELTRTNAIPFVRFGERYIFPSSALREWMDGRARQ